MLIPWKSWPQSSAARQIGYSRWLFRSQRPRQPRQQPQWLKHPVAAKRRRVSSRTVRYRRPFSFTVAALLVSGGVKAQYTNGGEVSMSCGDCECTGSSDDGAIEVFDNPSSGERTAYVAGEYSEILETSCGTSVIAVSDTLYELSGVDLTDRELHELSMSSSDCTARSSSSSNDCYSLDGGIDMDLTICLCLIEEGSSPTYKTNVGIIAPGVSSVNVDGREVCYQHGFVAQLVTAELDGNSHRYKFDLVISGHDSSADLSVSSAPDSDAGAFMCGDVESDTSESEPETDTDTPAPTPEPPVPTPGPESPDPTPSPVGPESTPSPVGPESTPSPVSPEPTPSSVGPEPTPPPLSSPIPVPVPTPPEPEVEPLPTSSPSPPPDPQTETESSSTTDSTTTSTTESNQPTATDVPEAPEPPESAVPETDAPVTDPPVTDPPVTDSPATDPPLDDDSEEGNQPSPAPESNTPAPIPTQEVTPAPAAVAATTSAPIVMHRPTAAPAIPDSSDTAAPVKAPTGETPAPLTPTEIAENACALPEDTACTQSTSVEDINRGIGTYYDPSCAESPETAGCEVGSVPACRACFFNTPLYMEEVESGSDLPDFINCPCCVMDVYSTSEAADENGPLCVSNSPAPTVFTPSPALADAENSITLSFNDTGMKLSTSEGFAVAALGIFTVLTFLPAPNAH